MKRDSNPLDRHELALIIENAEQKRIILEGRLKAIITKLIEWREDINDPHADSVQVVVDSKGSGARFSIRKME